MKKILTVILLSSFTVHAQDCPEDLSPGRLAYFEQIELHGLYVNDFKYVLGDPVAENALLQYAQDNGFNYLLLYNLTYIHNNLYDLTEPATAIVFANFIQKAKTQYGILQIGVVGETNGSFDKIEEFNNLFNSNWCQTVDVLNLEFEFWASTSSSTFSYYCSEYLVPGGFPCNNNGAFSFVLDELTAIDNRAESMGLVSEIYLGSPSNSQMLQLSEHCDRVLLHYYRTSDVYNDGTSIYNYKINRIHKIAQSNRKPVVMPIFSAGPLYMQTWLETHTLQDAMNTWLYGLDAWDDDVTNGMDAVKIAGYQWYRYTDLASSQTKAAYMDDEEIAEETIPAEKPVQPSFQVYPNPCQQATIFYVNEIPEGQYTLMMTNLLGAQVSEPFLLTKTPLELKTDHLEAGIYLLFVLDKKTGEKIYTTRLIKV